MGTCFRNCTHKGLAMAKYRKSTLCSSLTEGYCDVFHLLRCLLKSALCFGSFPSAGSHNGWYMQDSGTHN